MTSCCLDFFFPPYKVLVIQPLFGQRLALLFIFCAGQSYYVNKYVWFLPTILVGFLFFGSLQIEGVNAVNVPV